MSSRWWRGKIIVAALLLAASAVSARNLSPEDAARIKSISIRTTGNPSHYQLAIGNLGQALSLGLATGAGAVGGVLAGSAAASGRATTLDEALAPQHLMLGDEMAVAAEAAMTNAGYEVATAGQPGAVDATLLFEIWEIGYVRRVWGQIGPNCVVQVTLSDNQSGKTLFQRLYRYDMHAFSLGYTKVLDPDTKYGFENPSDVLTHPETVAAGFRAMIPLMINDLTSALRKPATP